MNSGCGRSSKFNRAARARASANEISLAVCPPCCERMRSYSAFNSRVKFGFCSTLIRLLTTGTARLASNT